MRDFRKLRCLAQAHGLFLIYNETQNFPREENLELTGQIRRAAVSIPTNIVKVVGEILKKNLKIP
jgi:four helix bundle protein